MQVFVNMLSGKILTLEVEGTHTVEEVHAMITAAEGIPAAEQCLLLGEGEGVRLERGMTMEDYEVRMETALRLALASAAESAAEGAEESATSSDVSVKHCQTELLAAYRREGSDDAEARLTTAVLRAAVAAGDGGD